MKHYNFVKEGEITAFADASLFSKEAIFKCLYWYGDNFHINVSFADSQTYLISLKTLSNANIKEDELDLYLQKLERDLIDYQLSKHLTSPTIVI